MGPLQFCISIFLGIYRNLKNGHPSPLLKIAEIALSNPCMKFEKKIIPNVVIWSAMKFESATKFVSGSVQVLIQVDKSG